MKILHLINDLGSGGAEKLLTDILPIMKEEGHEVSLIILNQYNSLGVYKEKLKNTGVTLIDFKKSFYSPVNIFYLIKLLRKEGYDIVHAHLFPSFYHLALASPFLPKKTKLVCTEHNVQNNRRKYGYLRPIDKWVYNRYNKVICITDLVEESLHEWLSQFRKSIVINNGVNLREISLAQKNIAKEDYNFINFNKKNILMVGRFNLIQKNHTSLVEAVALLGKEYHVYFAGTGSDMDAIKEIVSRLEIEDQVHFLGLRTDVYQLMHLMDLNVLSTHYEGLSGVTLEGLASGRPFIGSDVEGVKDVVPNDDFLFPDNEPQVLADKIQKVLNEKNVQDYLVSEGLKFVENYSIDKMALSYLAVYKEFIH
ncbi:glycosyltransferase [Flavobacterium humi]|uniref:Glycosyltransferase n=1 Tax=Flavobacterium humi TaxID=2562683 RepID=A0A4Z0L4H7_9FLAO|nr:glycosyltransferase [Flavobacterium humi]TGD57139.1 glycosyltransferase [Flavobacterium humi]